jgi:zinc protease
VSGEAQAPNGAVLLVEADRRLPLVHLGVAFRAGAVHDPPGLEGLARLTARMLRRGAATLDAQRIEERVESLGAELSTHAGLGSSALSAELLSRSLEPMSELMATLLAEPTFADDELARLVGQARAEVAASRDEDGLLASRALRRHLFAGHPHGRRTSGTDESLARIRRDDVVAFHRRHYNRESAIVTVGGDIDETTAARAAERLLAGLPHGELPRYGAPEAAPPRGQNLVIVDKPERTQCQLVVGTLGSHPRDADHMALLVSNCAFGGTFTSRLMQEVRVKRGWSYGASSALTNSRIREAFAMWSAPAAEDVADCLALELDLLRRWRENGLEAAELERSKHYLTRSYAFEIDTASKRLRQKLERVLLDLDDDYHRRFVERVTAVTLEQANHAVRARIAADALWVALVGTERDVGKAVRGALGTLVEDVVEPYDLE